MGHIQNMLQGIVGVGSSGAAAATAPKVNPFPKGSAQYWDWQNAQGGGGELPPAQAEAIPENIAPDGDTIVASAPPRLQDQTVRVPQWADLGGDPKAIDVNAPELVDNRAMIFNAQERRKQAEAKALGQVYEPQYQDEVGKDFKANPNLQFGTRGVLRDIVGNGVDFLGSLIGRRPTYRDEKIRDKMYGWDQGPEARAAAINRVMNYDPQAGMEIMKNLTAVDVQRTTADANAEFKNQQVRDRQFRGITGLATNIMRAPDVNKAYQAYRPALQKQLDSALGAEAPELPPEYDPNVIGGLPMLDFKGSDVQREVKSIRDNDLKERLQTQKLLKQGEWEQLRAGTRVKVAQIAADSRLSVAQQMAMTRKAIADDRLIETGRTEDLVTGTTSREYSPASTVRRNSRQIIYDKQGRAFYQYADGRMEPKQ